MSNSKYKIKRIWIPITGIVIILLLVFSPHLLSWFSDAFLFISGASQIQVSWQNQAELVSAMPNLRFQVSSEDDTQILPDFFFIEPHVSGTWSSSEGGIVIWQANQAIPAGEMIHFGFKEPVESTFSNTHVKPVDWQAFVRETEIAVLKQVSQGKEIFSLSTHTPQLEKQLTFRL